MEATYELLSCPELATKAVYELLYCSESAEEPISEPLFCSDLATEKVYELLSCSELAKDAIFEPFVSPVILVMIPEIVNECPVCSSRPVTAVVALST